MTTTVDHSRTLPTSDVDPFAHDILEDPHAFHAQLRDAGPVVYLTRYNLYAMARYEHVRTALVDWQEFSSAPGVGPSSFSHDAPPGPPGVLLEADPPRHDAPRRVLAKILGQQAVRRLREQWFTDARDLVDAVLTRAEFDAVPALAAAFPLRVFPDAVGLAREGRENLLPYGDLMFNAFGPYNDLVAQGAPRLPELLGWVNAQCARAALAEGGFGTQIWAAADRGEITHAQAPLVVRSLLTAGVDTTVNGLAALLYAVATHPDHWRRLREQPQLARVAFDEAVRWESPVQAAFRTATTDVRVGDTMIPEGAGILMFLGAANRDPRRWEHPDTFDPGRDPSGHVGLGTGIHQCVGQHIARLEAEALLTTLARRVEHIELAGPTRRRHNNTLRAWESLPVRVRLAR
ncbi:cytochrome P450 [Frankia sp. Cr2]|uniref:cytochrome P450 n=1 Tax=Frankia sp. Cr2 TaxID=3073932 RepID=UPI002AD40CC0|nr:cytochrome P450 [Frankia sp. Cr2]